jgi:hypothetical protein
LLDTAIDKLEPYGMFKTALLSTYSTISCRGIKSNRETGLQQTQPQLYEDLTKNLTPEEQSIIQAAINQADNIALSIATAPQRQAQATQDQTQLAAPTTIGAPQNPQIPQQQVQYAQDTNPQVQQLGEQQAQIHQQQQVQQPQQQHDPSQHTNGAMPSLASHNSQ